MFAIAIITMFLLACKGNIVLPPIGGASTFRRTSTGGRTPYLQAPAREWEDWLVAAPVVEAEDRHLEDGDGVNEFWVEETHGAIGTDLGGAKTKKDHMAALRLAKKLDTTVASSWSASHEPRNALAIFLGGFAAAHEINGGLVPLKAIVRIAKDLLREKPGLAFTAAVYEDVLSCLFGNAFQIARSLDGGWPLNTEEARDLMEKTAFLIRAHAAAKGLGTPYRSYSPSTQ